MNDHQKRLWQSMIDLIDSYLAGTSQDFCSTIGKLEGALDASEIQDKSLINEWYEFWAPLEIRRAVEGNNTDTKKAIEDLTKMKLFLIRHLPEK